MRIVPVDQTKWDGVTLCSNNQLHYSNMVSLPWEWNYSVIVTSDVMILDRIV